MALLTLLGLPLVLAGPKFLGGRAERCSYRVRSGEAELATTVA